MTLIKGRPENEDLKQKANKKSATTTQTKLKTKIE